MSYENMSPADYAAVSGNNNGWGFGGDGAWWIIILLLCGWGGRGFGGSFGGGCGTPATQADLAAGFNNSAVLSNLNDLALGQANLQHSLCQGFGDLGYRISDCCCTTQRAIDSVKYENAANTCALQNTINSTTRDIIDNANANSRAILDFIVHDKISALQAENQSLKLAASQSNQNAVLMAAMDANKAEILRRTGAECPTAAYIVQPPTPVTFPSSCCGQAAYGGCGGF
jgi:hypothetical protein